MRRRLVIGTLIGATAIFSILSWSAIRPSSGTANAKELGAPVLSARRTPEFLSAARGDTEIRNRIASFQQGVNFGSGSATCLSIRQGGRLVAGQQIDTPMIPASTLKIVTATAVLQGMGPETTFSTQVRRDDPIKGGVLDGPLFVVGGGDPLLFSNDYAESVRERGIPSSSLTALTESITKAGIKTIRGGLVGDDSRFDTERSIPSWDPAYRLQGQVGSVGPLLVNSGYVTVRGGRVAAPNPTINALTLLKDALVAAGVDVQGPLVAGPVPRKTEPVASIASLPLVSLVGEMLTFSDNTTAEMLLKNLSAQSGERGTTADGLAEVKQAMNKASLPTNGLSMIDGSGLDRADRATCRTIEGAVAWDGPDGPIASGLAVAGKSGTLRDRMEKTAASGRVRAKTGTLANMSAFAGWAKPDEAEAFSFATITNAAPTEVVRSFEDRLGVELAAARRTNDAEAFAPDQVQAR